MNIEEKRRRVIQILEEEACEICECSCGDRYGDMTADIDMDRLKEVAEIILKLFSGQEAK